MEKVELVKKLKLKKGCRYMLFMADVPAQDAFKLNTFLKELGFDAFLITANSNQINSLKVIEEGEYNEKRKS